MRLVVDLFPSMSSPIYIHLAVASLNFMFLLRFMGRRVQWDKMWENKWGNKPNYTFPTSQIRY